MFQYLIVISPLGLLYGSAGRFLSPENLVGRSGTSFPPSAATLSGLYAAAKSTEIEKLHLAGPFWAYSDNPQNFYVPMPFNYLLKDGQIEDRLHWNSESKQWLNNSGEVPSGKFDKGNSWVAIKEWYQPQQVQTNPWQYLPHLHPRLKLDERRVDVDAERTRGSLFLENAIQMNPDTCLIYLANIPIEDGWYRFGGEGHMVALQCIEIAKTTEDLLREPVSDRFALITPAI